MADEGARPGPARRYSWDEFVAEITKLREGYSGGTPLLFRGHANSEYGIATTLERQGPQMAQMKFGDYCRLIGRVSPAIETITGKDWKLPENSDIAKTLSTYDNFGTFPRPDIYSYMVYLRHHGFPSPLLDWTHSPFVAAFFAFREALPGTEARSIYVFSEKPGIYKSSSSDKPWVRWIGPYVRTHPRHFHQQSDYTICGAFREDDWYVHSHEDACFRIYRVEDFVSHQDTLLKIDIPSAERTRVLSCLNDYNLNAYTLFNSDDTLAETMWFREAVIKNPSV